METTEAAPSVTITHEPATYRGDIKHSYFLDLAEQATNPGGPHAERLQRHAKEQAERRVEAPKGWEFRANPSRTQGMGGYFTPPAWLLDMFATAPRTGRVLADLIPTFELPAGAASVNIPRITTGTQTGTVADDATQPSQDEIDAQVESPVVTISGSGDVALQLLEQSPVAQHLDWVFFKDLMADYDQQLETQLLTGVGVAATKQSPNVASQFYGLLNLAGTNTVTYTSATPTAGTMYPFIGQMFAKVGNNRQLPPEIWLMRSSRWAWIATAEDGQSRPFTPPGGPPIPERDPLQTEPMGSMVGLPVYPDDAIPTNLGGAGQDTIIACRPSDMVLFESTPRAAVMLEVLSGTLQARLQLHCYAAAVLGRYPTGVATLTGTGTIVQAGWNS